MVTGNGYTQSTSWIHPQLRKIPGQNAMEHASITSRWRSQLRYFWSKCLGWSGTRSWGNCFSSGGWTSFWVLNGCTWTQFDVHNPSLHPVCNHQRTGNGNNCWFSLRKLFLHSLQVALGIIFLIDQNRVPRASWQNGAGMGATMNAIIPGWKVWKTPMVPSSMRSTSRSWMHVGMGFLRAASVCLWWRSGGRRLREGSGGLLPRASRDLFSLSCFRSKEVDESWVHQIKPFVIQYQKQSWTLKIVFLHQPVVWGSTSICSGIFI